jgi:5'-3' exoribonuclease 1
VPMITATDDAFTRNHLQELELHLEQNHRESYDSMLKSVQRRNLFFPLAKTLSGYSMSIPLPKDQRFQLGARVVYCRAAGSVPFGAPGTIVRLLDAGQEAEVVYDDPFTGGSHLGGRLSTARGALTKLAALLVIGTASAGMTPLTQEPAPSVTSPILPSSEVSCGGSRNERYRIDDTFASGRTRIRATDIPGLFNALLNKYLAAKLEGIK